jgi:hypothetical protein
VPRELVLYGLPRRYVFLLLKPLAVEADGFSQFDFNLAPCLDVAAVGQRKLASNAGRSLAGLTASTPAVKHFASRN